MEGWNRAGRLSWPWVNFRRWIRQALRPKQFRDKLESEIAERLEIEKQLAHLASFPERDSSFIIETDLSGAFRYVNPAVLERFPEITTLKLRHPLMADLDKILEMLERNDQHEMNRSIKFDKRIYEQRISILEDSGHVRIYMTDITELKRLDQLKNDFVNTVSHELRTPLTTIKATVQLVSEGVLGATTEEQHNALSMALHNIDRLARMINDLLDISKIEAGKFELHRESMDLVPLLQNLGLSFQPLIQKKGLALQMHLPETPVEILADPDKITQILTNLLNNAIKFTSQGIITLALLDRGDAVECSVADTGRGIAEENLPEVFGKFEQFGPQSSAEKGSGLGLALSKGLTELHQGRITVESQLNRGARFTVTLPRLNATQIFKEKLRRVFDECAAGGRPFSIFHFSIKDWGSVRKNLGAEKTAALMSHFDELVKSVLRGESDMRVKTAEEIWLILPSTEKSDAREVAQRIEQQFQSYPFQQAAQTPVELVYKIASYPEDGYLLEKLLSLLQ